MIAKEYIEISTIANNIHMNYQCDDEKIRFGFLNKKIQL